MSKKKTYLGQLADEARLFQGKPAEQYAALCYRVVSRDAPKLEVLLITTRESHRWVIPKGWAMPERLAHQIAEREAWEEAGVKGKARKKPFGYYTYLKNLNGRKRVPSIVQVHLLEVESMASEYPEKGQRTLQWFAPHQASASVREPELQSLLRRVEAVVQNL